MTKADVIAGVNGSPVPSEARPGVLLRPLRYGDRAALMAWQKEHGGQPGAGEVLQRKLVALTVSDPAGVLLLAESDVDELGAVAVDELAGEAARRNGLAGGKASATENPS